jgi:VanZ family protein
MTGRRFTRILLTGLTIFWMAFIFGMSGADGESSSGMSGAVCEFIADTVIEDFDEYSMSRQQEIISRMQFYVRKAAHMTEYAVLAILLPATLALYGVSGRTLLWLGPSHTLVTGTDTLPEMVLVKVKSSVT